VVFVSNDSDLDGFEDYYGEMPWAAVPFPEESQRDAVGSKFAVAGIPRVVVLKGEDGSVVNPDARALITAKKTLSGIF
jgi:nucleoredoxin